MRKSTFNFVICILFPTIVGGISALLTRTNMELYETFSKPAYSPPAIVFPIAWSILYVMMGAASYRTMTNSKTVLDRAYANLWYLLQLAMNFLWSIFFFNLKLYLFSFLWLIAMFIAIVICTVLFFRIDKGAGWLMIPYNLWMLFAAYLNLSIVILNRTPMPI